MLLTDEKYETNVWLIQRGERFTTMFEEYALNMHKADYWDTLGLVYADQEHINDQLGGWLIAFNYAKHHPEVQQAMMDEDDLELFNNLDDTFTVYRGIESKYSNEESISWTLDKDKAQWFADRYAYRNNGATVLTATAKKEDVFATFVGRKESEVVISSKLLEVAA